MVPVPDDPIDANEPVAERDAILKTTEVVENLDALLVENLDDLLVSKYEKPPPHPDTVAKYLAFTLLAFLGSTILLHYVAQVVLMWKADATQYELWEEDLQEIFNTILPVVSGFAGAVVTYYFTREKDR